MADGKPTTAWRARGTRGLTITVAFNRLVVITGIGMVNGYAKIDPFGTHTNRYFQDHRVLAAIWTFSAFGSQTGTLDASYAQTTQMQTMQLTTPLQADTVTITITLTSPAEHGFNYTAISELDVEGQ